MKRNGASGARKRASWNGTCRIVLITSGLFVVSFVLSFAVSRGRIAVDPRAFDFGEVNSGESLHGSVTLRNRGFRGFQGRIQTSCSCLSVEESPLLSLRPFESRDVHFTLDSAGLPRGDVSCLLMIRGGDQAQPIVTIPISLLVQNQYVLYRNWVNFGSAQRGESRIVTIRVLAPVGHRGLPVTPVFSDDRFSLLSIEPPGEGNAHWLYRIRFGGEERLGVYETDMTITFSDFAPRSFRVRLRAEVRDELIIAPDAFRFSNLGTAGPVSRTVRIWSHHECNWSELEVVTTGNPIAITTEAIDDRNLLLTARLPQHRRVRDPIAPVTVRSRAGEFPTTEIPVLIDR